VLNKYISSNIKQEGAFKSPDKMTFDFLYPTKLTDEQIQLVEDKVNELIASNCEVETDLVTYDEAKERNAVGHFAEVYAKVKGKLRLVKMGGLQEICGGTHVSHLGDIENFLITKVTTKGSGA
jgi:alanyl-tRNA synthetase